MNNIKFVTDDIGNEHVIIDNGNDGFISMLKSAYEEKWGPIVNE
jgi:hypothetical protein